jgi:hypothetical protein
VMSGRGRMMYQCLQPEPEGAILPKRSAPQEVTSSPHDAGASINPANKLIRKRKGLVVAEEATIVKGIGASACLVRSGIVGSKESSDGHRVTRWTL